MTASKEKLGVDDEIMILTDTSGDTGKAAMEGFCDVPGTKIIVFYPHGGVSAVQQAQMATQAGENVCVCAVRGNFDDAQTGVKKIFSAVSKDQLLEGKGMAGGNGSIVGAIIGSLLIGTINNGLMFFGLSTAQQTVAKGAIIILSVALSALVSLRDNNNK